MEKKKIFVLSLMVGITILLLIIYSKNSSEIQIVEKGIADLYGIDLEKEAIELNGEWEFYGNKLLQPDDFLKQKQGEPTWIQVPGSWNQDKAGNIYPSKGCATYRVILKNIPPNMYFGLKKENIRNASRIFVNGKMLMEDGKPAERMENYVAGNNPQIIYFELSGSTAEIIVQATNYEYVVGGIANSLVFGQQQALMQKNLGQILFEATMITILIIIGIAHFATFLSIKDYRKREPAILPFALNSISFGMANGFVSQRILTIVFPMLTFNTMFKVFYFFVYITFITMLLVVNKINKTFLPDQVKRVLIGMYGLYLMGILFLPMNIFLKMARTFMIIDIIVLLGMFLWILYLYIKKSVDEISLNIHSILLLALFGANIYTIDQVLYCIGLRKDMYIGFISIVIYSLALMLLFIVRYSEAYEKNKEMSIKLVESYYNLDKTAEEARKNEIAFLQAQIKPHFLFNAMSSVISLCYTDGTRAGNMLSNLMNYLKRSFDIDNTSDYITIESELALIKSFIAIEKERFGDRIQIHYDIDPEVLRLTMIPLVIEPLVENAIRHGVLKNKQGGIVSLTIMKKSGTLLVSVEDNGKGMNAQQIDQVKWEQAQKSAQSNGIGLSNINARLRKFYGEELHFETGPQGTTVFFAVPLPDNRQEEVDDSRRNRR